MDKAKSKHSDKVPKPIKIKKEKTEENRSLQSMAYYVEDRLELIKQIFGTLKPKTIVNLAPEYLKKKKMEKIEEFCLTELLCISKKRLLAIINGTKCPTDTESSSDSDVQQHEEHISLEEISSDSEIEGENKRKAKKKKPARATEAADTTNKDTHKNNESEGVISVLELLELQARARAIRSQLALEPVTKIEVDTDEDAGKQVNAQSRPTTDKATTSSTKPTVAPAESSKLSQAAATQRTKEKDIRRKRKSQEAEQPATNADNTPKSKEATNNAALATDKLSEKPAASKKVKLKRNYRNANQSKDAEAASTAKKERKSRSPSPDVIPIVAEPETLLITDSSDEDKKAARTMGKEKTANDAAGAEVTQPVSEQPSENTTQRRRKSTETEEGEISDKEETTNVADQSIAAKPAAVNNEQTPEASAAQADEPAAALQTNEIDDKPMTNASQKEDSNLSSAINDNDTDANADAEADAEADADVDDDDDAHNDDVISIEGSDLETEITKHLETETPFPAKQPVEVKAELAPAQPSEESVIALNSSGDESREPDADQSWRSRYFRSTKVNKVLTASRLGKRVRDKIKQTKVAKSSADSELAREASQAKSVFESKHEDGSVEQYKELLELHQEKQTMQSQ